MRSLLIVSAAMMAISGAAFAQSANNGAGAGVSGSSVNTPSITAPVTGGGVARSTRARRRAVARRAQAVNQRPAAGIISSNGAGTTSTGGLRGGVGTTLSPTGAGGSLGTESGSSTK